MQWHRSGLIGSWEFLEEHIERKNGIDDQEYSQSVEKHSERKWGAMIILKSLQLLPTTLSAALKETTHNGNEATRDKSPEAMNFGNMVHIALVGINNQMSLLQDR